MFAAAMRLCSPWQRRGLPGAGPIKGFCSGWRTHCRKIVPRKISMVQWRKWNARQMTAAGPRRGPESGVSEGAGSLGHPLTPGLRAGLGVASGASRAQDSRGQSGSEAVSEVGGLSPPQLDCVPRHQAEGWGVMFEGPWARVRPRGAAGLGGGGPGDRKGAGLKVVWLIERQQPQIRLRPSVSFPQCVDGKVTRLKALGAPVGEAGQCGGRSLLNVDPGFPQPQQGGKTVN